MTNFNNLKKKDRIKNSIIDYLKNLIKICKKFI